MILSIFFLGWLGMALAFGAAWRWAVKHRNAGIVDVVWSLSLGAMVLFLALVAPGDPLRRVLFACATGFWSLRLGFHILQRLRGEAEEDGRYQHLRRHWGDSADRNFLLFFQGQAVVNLLFAAPIALLLWNGRSLTVWDGLGLGIIILSVLGERIADRQLDAWKADPDNRGKTCRKGLWAWSRHPNYFFEWLHWVGYPVAGLALWNTGWGLWWPLTLLGPAAMLFLLLRATGIPYTENQAIRSRGDDYRRYQREVSPFIPWFPKNSSP